MNDILSAEYALSIIDGAGDIDSKCRRLNRWRESATMTQVGRLASMLAAREIARRDALDPVVLEVRGYIS